VDLDPHVVAFALVGEGTYFAPGDQCIDGLEDGRRVQPEIGRPLTIDVDKELRLLKIEVGIEIDKAGLGREAFDASVSNAVEL
jgi:hypothetical protein